VLSHPRVTALEKIHVQKVGAEKSRISSAPFVLYKPGMASLRIKNAAATWQYCKWRQLCLVTAAAPLPGRPGTTANQARIAIWNSSRDPV
jgi:hypothetical protein